jgi:PAS domain-containing protein
VPVSFTCMYVVFLGVDLPLSWFLLIPAVWAGVMLTPYGAAVHALMQSLAAGVLALTAADKFTYEGVLPSSLIVDLLLTASTFITLQLALLRDERERAIIAERAQRREADAHSTLLGQVFDSMTDGMLLFSGDGELVRYNPAARQLLGRPLPARAPGGWAAGRHTTVVWERRRPGAPAAPGSRPMFRTSCAPIAT